MAGRYLTPRLLKQLGVVAGLVLLAHGLALQWLARQLDHPLALQPLVTPAFTRLLTQQAAPTPPPPPPKAARARPPRPHLAAEAAQVAALPSTPQPSPTVADPTPAPLPVADQAVAAAVPAEPSGQPLSAPAQAAPPVQVASAPAPAASSATASSGPAGLDSWSADTRLTYRLGGLFRNGDLYGSARVQWQREGARYQARVEIDVTLLASLVLTSQGEVSADGLVPRAYEEQRRNRRRLARLEGDNVTLDDGRVVRRPDGVQDTASQFIELAHRFATGREALEVGRSISFWMARPGGVDLWTYDIAARETLRTPQLGEVEAFHLKPRPLANARGNITAEMWFAPTLQHLPVRIKVNMGEATYVDLLVEKIEQR